jgi:hypothetical protein
VRTHHGIMLSALLDRDAPQTSCPGRFTLGREVSSPNSLNSLGPDTDLVLNRKICSSTENRGLVQDDCHLQIRMECTQSYQFRLFQVDYTDVLMLPWGNGV